MKNNVKLRKHIPIWFKIVGLLGALILLNFLLQGVFFRIDLTADKRYTISAPTKNLLKNLEQPIDFTIYLDGDLNQGFRQLKKATEDLMREFKVYGKSNVNFVFSSPETQTSEKARKDLLLELEKLEMSPVNVVEEDRNGKMVQKPVFPWVAVSIGQKTYPVKLLVNIPGKNGTENLNLSIQNLEYLLTDAIRILSTETPRKIAFIEGHGELDEDDVYDITTALSYYYQVDRGQIGMDPSVLSPYEALIIANPQSAFSEQDKYILDQYLMQGGALLWFLDGVSISLDSLVKEPITMGLYKELNLEDMLFRYGVRLNPVLLQDLQCALIPINTAAPGQKAEFHPMPWIFSPILGTANNHAITANLSPVKASFASSVDTVGSLPELRRTFLLRTAGQTNILQAPTPVNLELATANVDSRFFNKKAQAVAVLSEGTFPSVFQNRNVPNGIAGSRSTILKQSVPTRMIVVGDGDILRNDVEGTGAAKQVYPLNYDRYTRQELYGNKEFVLNAVNYLTDGEGWMELRNRKLKLRLLNPVESNEKRFKWQIINVLLPVVLLILIGMFFVYIRKWKYARKL